MKRTKNLVLLGVILVSVFSGIPVKKATASNRLGEGVEVSNSPDASVTVFRVFELSLTAGSAGTNPYLNGPTVKATFTGQSGAAAGKSLVVRGFWDGGSTWKIRFAPTSPGDWSYTTESSDTGLNGKSGRVTAVAPTQAELSANPLLHGFLKPDGYAWKLSDGTHFLPVGDTQWSFSEETTLPEWERWMQARQGQGYNTFLGSTWLAKYNRPEATGPPFPNKDPQTNTLQVAFFQRLDRMVAFANDHGIMMGLAIGGFPGNSDWFNRMGSRANNDRWFRYVIARYSAYNVRWLLYSEVNEANPPWGTTWQEEVIHSAQLVRDEDPYDHPLGSHHKIVDMSSAGNPNIDYLEVQSNREKIAKQHEQALGLRPYGKPIWFEEYWYEPATYDNDVAFGILNTHRNFIASMAFPTMGSLMRAHYPDFNLNDVESDPGAVRMCYFAKFYEQLDMSTFSPAYDKVDRGQAGRFGNDFVLFLEGGGSANLDLTGVTGSYLVTALDINLGTVKSLGEVKAGQVVKIDTDSDQDTSVLLQVNGNFLSAQDDWVTVSTQKYFIPSVFKKALPNSTSPDTNPSPGDAISECNF